MGFFFWFSLRLFTVSARKFIFPRATLQLKCSAVEQVQALLKRDDDAEKVVDERVVDGLKSRACGAWPWSR